MEHKHSVECCCDDVGLENAKLQEQNKRLMEAMNNTVTFNGQLIHEKKQLELQLSELEQKNAEFEASEARAQEDLKESNRLISEVREIANGDDSEGDALLRIKRILNATEKRFHDCRFRGEIKDGVCVECGLRG